MKPQTPPTIPAVDARERLLAAALEQFARRGYSATSVRELCEAAGVTKPVLYYYFKSKEGLYQQLMEESYSHYESILAELTSFSGNARELVIHFCTGLYSSYTRQLPFVKLCYSVYYGTPQGAPHFDLTQYYDRLLNVLAGFVEQGIARGEIKSGNVQDIVWTLMACLNITIEEQLCHNEPRVNADSMTRMLDLVFDAIANQS